MIKPVFRKSKWLTGLILLALATLLISGCAANELPVIASLTVSAPTEITPGVSCAAKCIASDPDEDELSYNWSADGGSFSGGGATVTWIAPDETGRYTITVEVSDGREGTDTEQLVINVLIPNNPPVINSLATQWGTGTTRLKKSSNTDITCEATDPDDDELTYSWSAVDEDGNSVGTFTGEGATVNWLAPNNYGTYTITVTVSDGRNGEASESVTIIVCSCASAH